MTEKVLKRDDLLNGKPQLLKVELPLYNGMVFVRPLTMEEQTTLADLGEKYKDSTALNRINKITLPVISWVLVNSDGTPWFEKDEYEDAAKSLGKLPASVVLGLQDKIIEFSGLTEESRNALAKNLMSQGPLPDSL